MSHANCCTSVRNAVCLLHVVMAPVYALCWPLFPNTERGMYCALSSRSRSLALRNSSANVHDRLLARGKRDYSQRYDCEDDEQERKVLGVGKRACPLRYDHDANDPSVLETDRRPLHHHDVIVWRWVCGVGGIDKAMEPSVMVEPFQVVAGSAVLCCI